MWDASTATCVHSQSLPHLPAESKVDIIGQHSLMHCSLVPIKSELVSVNVDRNICLYDAQTLELKKQVPNFITFQGSKAADNIVEGKGMQIPIGL